MVWLLLLYLSQAFTEKPDHFVVNMGNLLMLFETKSRVQSSCEVHCLELKCTL